MEDAVYREMAEVIGYELLLLRRFSQHGFQRKYHVSEENRCAWGKPSSGFPNWEGQYVGRGIPRAIFTVEPLLGGVIVEDNAEFDGSIPRESQGRLGSRHGQLRGVASKVGGGGTNLSPPDAGQ